MDSVRQKDELEQVARCPKCPRVARAGEMVQDNACEIRMALDARLRVRCRLT